MKDLPHPIIGITCGNDPNLPRLRDSYRDCVVHAGGNAVFLQPHSDLRELAQKCDGIIIPGGRDIDPVWYGESPHPETVAEESARTRFEISLLSEIIRERKPVLGICYGMQLINVFFEGSLYQDVRSELGGFLDHGRGDHTVEIVPNPYADPAISVVNSSHHQAVRALGPALKPFACAPDGIVEGFYMEGDEFLVGVQWHPERMKTQLTAGLFKRFVDACR